jgi:phosphonate transport system permease protein
MPVPTDVLVGEIVAAESNVRAWKPHRIEPGVGRRRAPWGTILTVMLISVSFERVLRGRTEFLNGGGVSEVGRFFRSAIHPKGGSTFLDLTFRATAVTVSYAVLATVLSGIFGLVVGIPLSRRWRRTSRTHLAMGIAGRTLRIFTRAFLVPLRGIHEVIWALLLLNVFGLDPLVAIGALIIPFGAITAKVFADHLDAVNPEAAQALRASGASEAQAFLYGVLPTALPDLTSYLFYRLECAIRAAAVLGVIGAGGLGYELSTSFQSLAYNEMWTLLFALIIVSGLADAISTRLRRRRGNRTGHSQVRHSRVSTVVGVLGTVAATSWSIGTLNLHPTHIWSDRSTKLFGELRHTWFPPMLGTKHLVKLLGLSYDTLSVSVVAIAVSAILAMPVAFLASRRNDVGFHVGVARRVASALARLLLLVTRAIPPSVWAFLTVLMFFSGLFPGAIALGIYNFGVLGRLLAEVVENLDPAPAKSLRARGARPSQVLAYAIAPVAASRFGAYGLYRWEVAARETIVVGIVAAGGLGNELKQTMASFNYPAVSTALLFFIGLTLFVDVLSAWLRRRIG